MELLMSCAMLTAKPPARLHPIWIHYHERIHLFT